MSMGQASCCVCYKLAAPPEVDITSATTSGLDQLANNIEKISS